MKPGIDYPAISVCFLCYDGNGNFVLSFRNENCRDERNKWDNGGGKLEFGDTIEATLKQEIKQEYCADILEQEFLGYRDAIREEEGVRKHWVTLDFLVLVDPSQIGNGEPEKFNEVRWFKPNELPREIHSQTPKFLEKYKEVLDKHGLHF